VIDAKLVQDGRVLKKDGKEEKRSVSFVLTLGGSLVVNSERDEPHSRESWTTRSVCSC